MHHVARVDLIRLRRPARTCLLAAIMVLPLACTSTSTTSTAPSATKCQVTATAAPVQFGAGGGTGTLNITSARDCGWTVAAQSSWVSMGGLNSGYGDASLSFAIAGNQAAFARTTEIVVDAQHFQISQAAAACTFSLSRSGDSVGASGGTVGFDVSTLAGCQWSASTSVNWLSLPPPSGGSGPGRVTVAVAANGGAARNGAVTVAGRTYSVSQDAATSSAPGPSPTPTPTPSPSPSPSPSPLPISVSGLVSLLAGSCPAIHFNVGGRLVIADRETDFSRGKCSDLSNGDTVSVKGTTEPDGSVSASRIEITNNAK